MTAKKELVRGGLAAVFGGIEKKSQVSPVKGDGVGGENVGGNKGAASIDEQKDAEKKLVRDEMVHKHDENAKKAQSYDPYAHLRRVKWPLLGVSEPYIIPAPEGFEQLNATINFRLAANLDATIDAHCRTVGAGKSEWIREAIKRYLADEQAELEKMRQGQEELRNASVMFPNE